MYPHGGRFAVQRLKKSEKKGPRGAGLGGAGYGYFLSVSVEKFSSGAASSFFSASAAGAP